MTEKLKIRQAVVVEGKYDKIKLSSILDACILTTEGFGLFKDEDKKALFRRLAAERGLIVASDADGAGLVIRNYFNSIIPKDRLFHVYIPEIAGKEKRKASPSKEGTLGLEGMEAALLRALFLPFAENKEGSDGNRNDASKEAAAEAAGGIRSASAEQAVSEAQSVSADKADPAGRESIGNDRGCAVSASPEGRGGKKSVLADRHRDERIASADRHGGERIAPADRHRDEKIALADGNGDEKITLADFYEDRFWGREDCEKRRKALLRAAALPANLSAKALVGALNALGGRAYYEKLKRRLDES